MALRLGVDLGGTNHHTPPQTFAYVEGVIDEQQFIAPWDRIAHVSNDVADASELIKAQAEWTGDGFRAGGVVTVCTLTRNSMELSRNSLAGSGGQRPVGGLS